MVTSTDIIHRMPMKLTDLFSKKKHLWSEDLWSGQTDFHSHILFGVDDGVQTLNESVSILERYETWGVTDVWCTPHIMEDIPNKTQDLRIRFDELRAAYKGTIRLHLAAEYMIDSLFIERLSGNDLLPIGDDANKILVETSYYTAPERFMQILEEIKSAGYHPLLAHPERYAYMNKDFYADLKGKNILFQLNIGSLVGVYGAKEVGLFVEKRNVRFFRLGHSSLPYDGQSSGGS